MATFFPKNLCIFFFKYFFGPLLASNKNLPYIYTQITKKELEAGVQMSVTYHLDFCELIYILFHEI